MSRPSLFITSLNGIDIPPEPKPNLGLAKIVTVDIPPTPSSNNIIENLQTENEQLKYDLHVLKFILKSYEQDESNNEEEEPDENFEDKRKESYECNFCYFETESFENMKTHRRNFHNEDFSLL